MLAQRMTLVATSGTAGARAAAKAFATTGKEIVDLSAGEVASAPPHAVVAGALAALERGENRYTETVGIEPLRAVIARRLSGETGHAWIADEVAVTAGAKQALFNIALALLDPGDEVIIPAPYWATFPAQVRLVGARPVLVGTRASGYVPSIEKLAEAVTPATRAIVVNTPSNPVGAVFGEALLRDIAELAALHDLWVIFDECYGSFVHPPLEHHNFVRTAPQLRHRTLIVNSFSKSLALTGWRLGYVAGPKDVIAAVKAVQSHTTSNPNVIAQHAVLAHLLQDEPDAFAHDLRERLSGQRARGLAILSELVQVPVVAAQGGFYFYLDLSDLLAARPRDGGVADADDVARLLLAEAGVATVSGSAFGDAAGLRLTYGVLPDLLERGLTRLVTTLNALARPQRAVA
ncbi:pyridoxal phosphate-dependent aminotransferase [Labrys wisconsinensis]|uniref:Aminotransferase n=1 Tax=Labrys wisconsinensis TaxID=425677 RepID=A0ABU0J9U9_9HYPH|nr:aminotransferase class I/II-fold pyridoxal phosphate-dependent enzyme [Labrys wisconsinensis]MDQ0471050.1 aspartate aminotransferase [Labrys wisconsinensis]